jgi:diguanylate cyclase (GGDEF)-like protein
MTSVASTLPTYPSDEALAGDWSPAAVATPRRPHARRIAQRRKTYLAHAVSYVAGAAILLLYAYAGTISYAIAPAFLVSGLGMIGIFVVLSETGINDRRDDHYLTVFQIVGHDLIPLTFALLVPQIGYAFLCILFFIFGFGAIRMTPRQAAIAMGCTVAGLIPVFLFAPSIGIATTTPLERVAALLCFLCSLGQCAFVGLYGSSLRKTLFNRSAELKEAYRRIEELAELDELTGSFNRRCIMRMLDDEIARAQRVKTPCAVALIDLDWFKRINDAHGHPIGDEVLRTFAITVFANIRGMDRFGRYGGEEFLLILPETSSDAAAHMLNRLRMIVADLDWSALSHGMAVTISAGVATLNPDETADALLTRADKALYEAKEAGRNRVAST